MKNKINKACILLFGISLLFLSAAYGQEPTTKLKVVTEQSNIRLKPDIGSIIIKQVSQGTLLESTGKQGEWYRLKLASGEGQRATGYVHESTVIVIGLPPQKEETKEIIKDRAVRKKIEEERPPLPIPKIPAPSPPLKSYFAVSFFGGGNYVSGGELNEGARGMADFYRFDLTLQGEGEIEAAHLGYILGGECSYRLSDHFTVGFGIEYFQGKKESLIEFREGTSLQTLTTLPEFKAVPLRLFISYYPVPYFYVKTGIEYYTATCSYLYQFYGHGEPPWQEWKGEAKAHGFGIMGGLGFEVKFFSVLNFILEATGRYSKIKGFEGTGEYRDSALLYATEEGTLYFYKAKVSEENIFPQLFILEKKPTDAGIVAPREAIIDFSGITFRAGIKINF
ncbi:MAG: SH3 domain-containing protein [Candidatus Aminicenantes bacterium]|nr:SH3 domain-containing protein [Candidatus Aminicenantes bacterium]